MAAVAATSSAAAALRCAVASTSGRRRRATGDATPSARFGRCRRRFFALLRESDDDDPPPPGRRAASGAAAEAASSDEEADAPFAVLANATPLATTPKDHDDDDATSPAPTTPFVATADVLRFCEPDARPMKVAVLLSGGVDSSVALTLLQAAGHDVTAFYLQIWFQEDFRNYWDQCPWEDDLSEARAVCDLLRVPLEVVPLTRPYWDLVVSHSVEEISRGRTPNPDMLCNSRVKFGAFREWLAETHPGRFARVASGHYAALERPGGPFGGAGDDADADGKVKLVMSGDAHKDQTYFLAALSQAQLEGLSFPIGGLPKAEIRDIARRAGLPNANRKDSQGICFLGKVKFSEFVAEHLGERPGKIVEIETGLEIGEHRGFWFHTIGQRSGLGLSGGPWYVCGKDAKRNIVFITKDYYAGDKERRAFRVGEFNWISGEAPAKSARGYALGFGDDADDADANDGDGDDDDDAADDGGASEAHVAAASISELYCKVRHGERRYRCTLKFDPDGEGGRVVLDANDQGLAAGQFAVFYDGRECLGSGVIAERAAPIDVKVLVDPKSAAKRRSSDNSAPPAR